MNQPHYHVCTMRLNAAGGVPGTVRRLNPDGYFIQPMINRTGDQVVFWGHEKDEVGFNIWCHDGALSRNDAVGCSLVEVGRGVTTAPLRVARELRKGGLETACPTGATASFRLRKLTDDRAVTGHPFWSADSQRIVYFSTLGFPGETDWIMEIEFQSDRSPRNLWIMDPDGTNRRQLTTGAFIDERPCISPDGKTVVFVSNRSGPLKLWQLDLPTGKLQPVTSPGGLDYRPIFSPTGDRLAYFTTNNPRGVQDLCIMDWPNGPTQFPVPPGHFKWIHGPFWLPDGNSLIFHVIAMDRTKNSGLWQFNLTTKELAPFYLPGINDNAHGSTDEKCTILTFDTVDSIPYSSHENKHHTPSPGR